MSAETCINHPERAAVERCEVCHNPLCAYCLYYTSDGQRLCQTHANQAAASGAFIRAPGVYADGLIPAQVAAGQQTAATPPYLGNQTDLLALFGIMLTGFSLAMCIPGAICLLGPIGMILSAVALINAKDAHNPPRTRRLAGIGLGLFGLWLVVAYACASLVFNGAKSSITTISTTMNVPIMVITAPVSVLTAQPSPTPPPSDTPTPSSGR